ncbi:MAG: hypothetical protein IPG45_10225 [Deltaproteobacteria bacterium]|nr:hypothetical protein [Deltaproteobacteria bacterium]
MGDPFQPRPRRSAQQTYRATIAYEGRAFGGYARQLDLDTVEAALLEALGLVLPAAPTIAVAGRTDRGVSAIGQVVSFRAGGRGLGDRIQEAIDRVRPGSLTCLEVREVDRRFHAQFSARARRYVYLHPDTGVDIARLDRMLGALQGRRCFGAFARDTPPGQSTVRSLREARARREQVDGQAMIRFDLLADAFLRRMVRVLVATAIREAVAGAADEALVVLAAAGDRRGTALPAPAEGLTLSRVIY